MGWVVVVGIGGERSGRRPTAMHVLQHPPAAPRESEGRPCCGGDGDGGCGDGGDGGIAEVGRFV